jgi:hypothetical protein
LGTKKNDSLERERGREEREREREREAREADELNWLTLSRYFWFTLSVPA